MKRVNTEPRPSGTGPRPPGSGRFLALASLITLASACFLAIAQEPDILRKITRQERTAIAVPDFRGTGEAQQFMNAFNEALWNDLEDAGIFQMVPKGMYPLETPQRPQDFRPPLAPAAPARKSAPPPEPVRQGPWLTDWSQPPVSSTYLAFGYSAAQEGRLVVYGYLYNVIQPDLSNAQVFGKLYFGSLDEAGARQTGREFAADILDKFGFKGLLGTKIYFDSTRSGFREIWSMDPDGSNQKQVTFYRSDAWQAGVSPDATKLAYVTFAQNSWLIRLQSLETGGRLPFFNPPGSQNATPTFTPDGKRILFSTNTVKEGNLEIYIANTDGRDMTRLTFSGTNDAEPRVNPKTGNEVLFVSDRSGMQQVYLMSVTGANPQRLTDGTGEAVHPSWHPDGQLIAFAWTKGFAPGNYNIFVMDVATRELVQLTHGAGRNENPVWAPDGRHIAFSSNRNGGTQIWTMLADGTQLRQLTTLGANQRPVWK